MSQKCEALWCMNFFSLIFSPGASRSQAKHQRLVMLLIGMINVGPSVNKLFGLFDVMHLIVMYEMKRDLSGI